VLALIFIALAAATIVGAVLSGGDDSSPKATQTPAQSSEPKQSKKADKPKKAKKAKKNETAAATPAPAPAPAGGDPARGAELNDQGFMLMNQGNYDGAIPLLQEAVASFPEGTSDLTYAYALFNLGKALRLAGRPDDAIPVLERRLQIPNQTETVQNELDLARQQARGGGGAQGDEG
jgi:serine/threonine-protein kinase